MALWSLAIKPGPKAPLGRVGGLEILEILTILASLHLLYGLEPVVAPNLCSIWGELILRGR